MTNNLTRDEAATRSALLATESYAVHLDLTGDEKTFRSTSTVRFTAAQGSSTFIELTALTADRVLLNGNKTIVFR